MQSSRFKDRLQKLNPKLLHTPKNHTHEDMEMKSREVGAKTLHITECYSLDLHSGRKVIFPSGQDM